MNRKRGIKGGKVFYPSLDPSGKSTIMVTEEEHKKRVGMKKKKKRVGGIQGTSAIIRP